MIIPGLVSVTLKAKPVEEVIALALRAGLSAIEWSENHHLPKGDEAFAERVGNLTRESGLEIAGYGSYYRLGEGMDIRESLGTAAALGASQVRIWAGSRPSSALSPEERKALIDELSDAVKTAEGYGMVLNLEWHKNTLTDENLSGLDVLKSVSSPFLRTLWQPTQALSFASRCEGLEMVLPFLSYFHVYYWDESGRRPLEEGTDHWKKYFSVLDAKKDYYALLEFVKGDSEEQFIEDAAVLKELLKGV